MPVEYWWPTPIYYSLFDEDPESLSAISKEVDSAIAASEFHSPWEESKISTSFFYNKPNIFLNSTPLLKNYIIKHVKKFTDIDFFIDESWANIGGAGGYQEKHEHLGSHISGTYYHNTNKKDGNIQFYCNDKLLNQFYGKEMNSIKYEPEIGKIVLFPSYLTHIVQVNKTENLRTSIAFNIYKGKQ